MPRESTTAAARSHALARVARALAADGLLTAWRDERYVVSPTFGAPPWFELERAAARYFGIRTYAAHVNGLVRRDGETAMWIARRSPDKPIDPGMLDNLVGGGVAVGQTVASTVIKEAWEEAGVAANTATLAQPAGAVHICREQPDGLQRETIFVHDLWLAPDFVPAGQDGEVSRASAGSVARARAHSSPTAADRTSSLRTPRSSFSTASSAMARSHPTRRTTLRSRRCGIRRIACRRDLASRAAGERRPRRPSATDTSESGC